MAIWSVLLTLLFTSLTWAECSNSVDSKKVMLFIDANNNLDEVKAAQKAACKRGDKLVVVPENYVELGKLKNQALNIEVSIKNCETDCEKRKKELQELTLNLQKIQQKQKPLEIQLENELRKIKTNNAHLIHLSISGHDGGGQFQGSNFKTSRLAIAQKLKNYPEINQITSLMLLGCYSNVQKEALDWKNIFPQIRFIAGYDGSAPLGFRPAGHSYIYEILTKEKDLLWQSDQIEIQKYLKKSFKSMNDLNSSLFFKPYCDEKDYFYGTFDKYKELSQVDLGLCQSKKDDFVHALERVTLYIAGELDPEASENQEELGGLYRSSRRFEHCLEINQIPLNISHLFNLRFYKNIKENYVNFYLKDLKKVESILNESNYLSSKVWVPNQENIKSMRHKDILNNIHEIHKILSSSGLEENERSALRFLSDSLTQHLYHFENPFSWFETSKNPETPESPVRLL